MTDESVIDPVNDARPPTQREMLIRLDGKVDLVLQEVKGHTDDLADHETRIRSVEDRMPSFITWKQFWGGLGGLGALGVAIVTIAAFLTHVQIN